MEAKNDILEELRSLSALVATISRETPYRVPAGYFVNFPELVLEKVGTKLVAGASKPLPFSVPDGYFEGFAQQMLARVKSGSGSTGQHSEQGLGEQEALSAAMEELPAILAQAPRITPYRVPEGYFDELAPVLAVVKGKNPYTVPAGYFDHLAEEIHAKNAKPAAKVISFGKRMNWLKYSAAAVVAGLLVTVGWLRWHTSSPSPLTAAVQTQAPVDVAKNLSKVSDQELQNFLVDQDTDTTLAQPVNNNALMATVDMDDTSLKSLLGDVSDGELKQYMDEHGGANDIATN